jgi:peptidoglycan hydrolase-like protein with peptidoglycan-binding domain
MDFPAYWCDAFVDWCFYKAYGVSNAKGLLGGNFDDYTVASAQLYKNKKAWYTKNPKVGDQIFFTNGARICHTGLVYKVDDKYVYTIEGNTSGASGVIANGGGVCKKKYLLTNPKIQGYGRPKYDVVKTNPTTGGNYMFKVPSLVKGDNGKAVSFLQKLLVGEGYKLTVDGDFGAKTENAVAQFQKREGIKVTYPGTVGVKTWNQLIGL